MRYRSRARRILAGKIPRNIFPQDFLERFERDDAGLHDRRIEASRDLDPAAPPWFELHPGRKRVNGQKPKARSKSLAFLFGGNNVLAGTLGRDPVHLYQPAEFRAHRIHRRFAARETSAFLPEYPSAARHSATLPRLGHSVPAAAHSRGLLPRYRHFWQARR